MITVKKYKTVYFPALIVVCLLGSCNNLGFDVAVPYSNNENEENEDLLTPGFYDSEGNAGFRAEVNNFVYFARQVSFRHPLANASGQKPEYKVRSSGEFGAIRSEINTGEHHPAVDMYVGNRQTNVTMYAAYDGAVQTYRNADKYWQYLSLTKEVKNSTGTVIGKMVTLYAHIDLDLDEADGLLLNDTIVKQGDIVSKHLYANATGGPHLHFEIRYYRPADAGTEEYYSFIRRPPITEPSGGNWTMGYWDYNVGYGFGNPENHFSGVQ